MKLISSVRIEKFRSINVAEVKCEQVTIFSGKNNSGKSNALKALNLFFNGVTSYDSDFSYDTDFNLAYTGHRGGKREIVITIYWVGYGEAALKKPFSVTRRFGIAGSGEYEYRSSDPIVQEQLEKGNGNVVGQFTRFMNKMSYIYVPAIRDKDFVQRLFRLFELSISGTSKRTFDSALSSLNTVLQGKSAQIGKDFKEMMRLATRAKLSTRPVDVLDSIGIEVESGIEVRKHSGKFERQFVDLFATGDGVLMSYVPHFLNYLANVDGRHYIWGFEEPENSLEYTKVQVLAQKFATEFTQNAQIFLTTHSPAFVKLDELDNAVVYRVYIDPDDQKQISEIQTTAQLQTRLFADLDQSARRLLEQEIGMVELAQEIESRVREVTAETAELRQQISNLTRPVVYSEGKNHELLQAAKEMFDPNGQYDIIDGGGKSRMKNVYQQMISVPPRQKAAFVWDVDCESNRSLEASAHVLPLVLGLYPGNERILRGIEASLPESEIVKPENRSTYFQEVQLPTGGMSTKPRKEVIAEHFITRRDKGEFKAFKPIFDRIQEFM